MYEFWKLKEGETATIRFLPEKGDRGGACAREACSNPSVMRYHPVLRWYYCEGCAKRINAEAGYELVARVNDEAV